jgi:hypothetical protein
MSLPACQQRVLDRIEHSLHACDPRLRAMFAIFTKLTKEEEMPRLEKLELRWLPRWGCLKRLKRPGQGRRTARSAWAPGAGLRATVLVPIALLLLASAALLGFGARTVRPCGPPSPLQKTAPALSRAKTLSASSARICAPTTAERMTSWP